MMNVKGLFASTANYLGFLDVYAYLRRKITKSQVAILMYHRVSPKQDDWSFERLSPKNFEMQMKYFCRNYEIISLNDLVQYIKQEKPFPKKAVVITFDDGYKDNYLYAYPILKKYRIPATIFLTSGHIGRGDLFWWDKVSYIVQHTKINQLDLDEFGNYPLQSKSEKFEATSTITENLKKLPDKKKNLLIEELLITSGVEIPIDLGKEFILSWNEVIEMSNNGIDFGAHTVTHPILTNLSLPQIEWELIQSKKEIERMTGKQITTFAYPNGNFNTEISKLLKKNGFTCAVTTIPKLVRPKDHIYELGRIESGKEFCKTKVVLSGAWDDITNILK
ncbi:polysaccharide deacetylase family protein [Dehalococcoidia bacterium]|nr:polysaccharide deacetylase family protein [Dehalococcoidia bacterium]